MESKNEIVIYQPNNTLQLEVMLENETVWLTQAQMVMLFGRDQSVISKHIRNIFKEKELNIESNMQILHITNIDRPISFYSLDVIISVGYRIKSIQGTLFRQWANRVLKDYLLRGYVVNQRFEQIDNTLSQHEQKLLEHQKQIDFIVRTELPPKEGIFFEGQIFDAYVFTSNLIKSAEKSIILLDNYVDESVLLLLSKRNPEVVAKIYTKQILPQLQLDLTKHNKQYNPINIYESDSFHDRFLLIDNTVYHIGASLKDLGKKLFAFSKMEIKDTDILKSIKN